MPVGMQGSRPASNVAASAPPDQNSPVPTPLRSGEKQASTQAALADPDSKTYYHRIAGAKAVMPDGLELHFLAGRFVTNEANIIAELDKVANRGSSMIFTEQSSIASATAAEAAAAADASNTAGTLRENQ